VFIALIINAIEAMEKGGRIVLQTDCQSPDQVIARIADSGRGVPQELLPHIFEPFFTSKDSKNSLGLGLSVVYAIIQSHGGIIEVDSKLGQGTTFTITLPRKPGQKTTVEESLMHDLSAKTN